MSPSAPIRQTESWASQVIELTLLSRSYCHLCEDMLAAIMQHPRRAELNVKVVDVDAHPEQEARYGILVPVLLDGETEICHYHLDVQRLDEHLRALDASIE